MSFWVRYDPSRAVWEVSGTETDNVFSDLRENFPIEVQYSRWAEFLAYADARQAVGFQESYNRNNRRRGVKYDDSWRPKTYDTAVKRMQGRQRGFTEDWQGVHHTVANPPVSATTSARMYFDKVSSRMLISEAGNTYRELSIPQYGCCVYGSGNQSINDDGATHTLTMFDSEEYDDNNFHEGVTNPSRLTIPITGRYRVWGVVQFAANGTGYRQARILLNGTTVIERVTFSPNASVVAMFPVYLERNFTAGDFIELDVRQTSTAALLVNGGADNATKFGITFIKYN
jgi:hypothetical protein